MAIDERAIIAMITSHADQSLARALHRSRSSSNTVWNCSPGSFARRGDRGGQVRSRVGADIGQMRRGLGPVGRQELADSLPLERRPARQGEERHRTEAVHVAAGVHGRFARRLLQGTCTPA